MKIAYPFVIYKDSTENILEKKEPVIHLNTLAQIIYRVYSHKSSSQEPLLLVNDPYAIEGVGESGLFKIDFTHSYVCRVEEIQEVNSDIGVKDLRLGIVHEINDTSSIEQFSKALLLHGELREVIDKSFINGKEVSIQWITR